MTFQLEEKFSFPPHLHLAGAGADALHRHSENSSEAGEDSVETIKTSTDAPEVSDLHLQPESPADPVEATGPSAEVAQDSELSKHTAFGGISVAPEDIADHSTEGKSKSIAAPTSPARPASQLFTQSESAFEVIAESFAKFGPPQPRRVPEIRIHRPSGTVMAASLGTTAMNSINVPVTPMQSAVGQTHAPVSPITDAVTASPLSTDLPVDPSTVTNATIPALPLPLPSLPAGVKVGKKKKVVRKARKLIIRRRLLAIILGRDLAKIVHPQLTTVANPAGGAPLSVDGASDLVDGYARQIERRRDIQRRRLDQKVASARIHAEAEEIHRCRICRGLTRTRYLQKYHRLQLKRDKPDMSAFNRRATAMARVAAFKCKCNRQLLGVENEETAKDVTASRHLRAPAATGHPLPGVDGALPQEGW